MSRRSPSEDANLLAATSNGSKHHLVQVDESQSLFAIKPTSLMELVDPKDPEKLAELGGVTQIAKDLFTDISIGLSTDQSIKPNFADRTARFGRNFIPPIPPASFFSLVCEAFKDKILILLTVAAFLSLGIGIYKDVTNAHPDEPKIGWIEGFAIMVAVVIVVLVSSVNDYQKDKQFRKLNAKKEDRMVKVMRNGSSLQISIFDILVGDVVLMEPGDVVPVDGIVIESHNLSCDESGATGESKVIKKGRDDNDPFLLSGTKVTEGVGKMIAIAVGPNSFHGKTLLSLQVKSSETPLEIKLDNLAESIAKLGAAVALLMLISLIIKFVVEHSIKGNFPDASGILAKIVNIFIQAITIVVVAVPEGLPMAVTLALAFATTRMLKDNNLVRVLSACETMGNATTICSDKTGTLTENKMTVVQGELVGRKFEGDLEIKSLPSQIPTHVFDILSQGIAVNSSAFETKDAETGQMEFVGSHTEIALLNFLRKMGYSYEDIRNSQNITDLFPFSSQRKSMATIIKTEIGYRIFSKGASEIILSYCKRYIDSDGNERDLDSFANESFNRTICGLASGALRTIGLAYRDITTSVYEEIDKELPPNSDLVLIGIVGIEDPLRQGVKEAVLSCQNAGIFIRMVTGDNILTAQSIAKKCGILMKGGIIMEGPRFRKLSDEALTEMVPRLQVLARSSPLDKQILVRKLKEMGEVVAVTGDGTNDGPALKAADVGFSMGITGTEVAKEASSIILMDDNFTSIVKAVSWGRCVNDSVRKFLQFQLTVNVTAVVVAFVSALLDEDDASVLTAVQLLWVNLIMDT